MLGPPQTTVQVIFRSNLNPAAPVSTMKEEADPDGSEGAAAPCCVHGKTPSKTHESTDTEEDHSSEVVLAPLPTKQH